MPDECAVSLHVAPAGAGVSCQVLINRTEALWHLSLAFVRNDEGNCDEAQFKERAMEIAAKDPFSHSRYLSYLCKRTVLHALVTLQQISMTDKTIAAAVASFVSCFPSSASLRAAFGRLPLHLACRNMPETENASNNTYFKTPGTGVRTLTIQQLAGHVSPNKKWSLKDLLTLRGAVGAEELVFAKLEDDPACAREHINWHVQVSRHPSIVLVDLQCTALHLALLMCASDRLMEKLVSCFPAAVTSRVHMSAHDSFDASCWAESVGRTGLLPGMLPLHVLARNVDSTHAMRALLNLDSSVCAVADGCGHVPLHLAAQSTSAPLPSL